MAYAFNDDKSKFDLDETVDNVDSLIGNMAVIETSPVTTNHSTGEYIMYNGTLLKVLSPIATGENLVLGTNVTPINFGSEIKSLQDSVDGFVTFKNERYKGWRVERDGYIIVFEIDTIAKTVVASLRKDGVSIARNQLMTWS